MPSVDSRSSPSRCEPRRGQRGRVVRVADPQSAPRGSLGEHRADQPRRAARPTVGQGSVDLLDDDPLSVVDRGVAQRHDLVVLHKPVVPERKQRADRGRRDVERKDAVHAPVPARGCLERTRDRHGHAAGPGVRGGTVEKRLIALPRRPNQPPRDDAPPARRPVQNTAPSRTSKSSGCPLCLSMNRRNTPGGPASSSMSRSLLPMRGRYRLPPRGERAVPRPLRQPEAQATSVFAWGIGPAHARCAASPTERYWMYVAEAHMCHRRAGMAC